MTPKEAFIEAKNYSKQNSDDLTIFGKCFVWIFGFPTIFIFTLVFIKSGRPSIPTQGFAPIVEKIKEIESIQGEAVQAIKKIV